MPDAPKLPAMKVSKEGIKFPRKCPLCGKKQTVLATYADGAKFIECNGCYSVIGEVHGKQVWSKKW